MIGSRGTRVRILSSRDMKFDAHMSSSRSKSCAPISKYSMMFDACDVEPDALVVENGEVFRPNGRLLIKGEISTDVTALPSSL